MTASRKKHYLKDEEEVIDQIELKESLTIECVCPKCGSDHRMKMIWTGRGKPKKFCPPCKIFVASIEQIDFCSVPSNMDSRIE
ncbi:MAG: hypothetical protein P8X68_17685 [Desulfobacterales bacterium]|jgi:hypothetical protein